MNYSYIEGYWEISNHKRIKISDMGTSHLVWL